MKAKENKIFIKDSVLMSSLGHTLADTFQNIKNGTSGIYNCRSLGILPTAFDVQLAAPILVHEGPIIDELSQTVSDRFNRALTQFAEKITELNKRHGPFDEVFISNSSNLYQTFLLHDPGIYQKYFATNYIAEVLIKKIRLEISPQKIFFLKAACSTGILILNLALRKMSQKPGVRILVLGIENEICAANMFELEKLGAYSYQGDPKNGCLPFHKERQGMVKGEALVGMVLESAAEDSLQDGTVVLRPGHTTSDAYRLTDGLAGGEQVLECLKRTIPEVEVATLDAVCVHGTSTVLNDQIESIALNNFFSSRNTPISAFALKPYIGHTLDSSGLVETLLSSAFIQNNFIPPLLTAANEDGLTHLTFAPRHASSSPLNSICKLSIGFGGINAALMLQKKF